MKEVIDVFKFPMANSKMSRSEVQREKAIHETFIYLLIHLTYIDSGKAQFEEPWINITENKVLWTPQFNGK